MWIILLLLLLLSISGIIWFVFFKQKKDLFEKHPQLLEWKDGDKLKCRNEYSTIYDGYFLGFTKDGHILVNLARYNNYVHKISFEDIITNYDFDMRDISNCDYNLIRREYQRLKDNN